MIRSLRAIAVAALVLVPLGGAGGLLWPAGAPALAQEDFGGLPAGEHRSLVFAVCSGCHSVKLVMQQGMSRSKWDSTLDWMTEQQGMPALDPDTEAKILDYLASHFGTEKPDANQTGGGLSPYNRVQPMQPPQ